MPRSCLTAFLVITPILGIAGCTSLTGLVGGTGGTSGGSSTTSAVTAEVLTLVNAERAAAGLSALSRNSLLDAAALAHADDMAANGFFSHTGSDGSDPGVRAARAGYVWTAIAENIGQGDTAAQQMMNLWMNSSGHRANILSPTYTQIGIAINTAGHTWVQVFGRPQ